MGDLYVGPMVELQAWGPVGIGPDSDLNGGSAGAVDNQKGSFKWSPQSGIFSFSYKNVCGLCQICRDVGFGLTMVVGLVWWFGSICAQFFQHFLNDNFLQGGCGATQRPFLIRYGQICFLGGF